MSQGRDAGRVAAPDTKSERFQGNLTMKGQRREVYARQTLSYVNNTQLHDE